MRKEHPNREGSRRSRALARTFRLYLINTVPQQPHHSEFRAGFSHLISSVNDCNSEALQPVMSTSVGAEYERPKLSLSCLQCQTRKRKCDKKNPCQACRQAGIACTAISRARLPRGRHAVQRGGGDPRQRIARLEQLLSSQRNAGDPVNPTPPQDQSKLQDSAWTSISEESWEFGSFWTT